MANFVFFHAHPDDEAIATGGTMKLLTDAGHNVLLLVATDGALGETPDGVLSEGETLAQRREAETLQAAELLGGYRVEQLGYQDSGMAGDPANDNPDCFWQSDTAEVAEKLARILEAESCDVLVIYDPNGNYGHPDHIQVHRAGMAAAELAGTERVYWATMNRDQIRRQMAAQGAAEELLQEEDRERAEAEDFGMPEADITHAVDVSSLLDLKRAALKAHASQIQADSFFVTMDDAAFQMAFGTEWYVAAHLRGQPGHPPAPTEPGQPPQFYPDLLAP